MRRRDWGGTVFEHKQEPRGKVPKFVSCKKKHYTIQYLFYTIQLLIIQYNAHTPNDTWVCVSGRIQHAWLGLDLGPPSGPGRPATLRRPSPTRVEECGGEGAAHQPPPRSKARGRRSAAGWRASRTPRLKPIRSCRTGGRGIDVRARRLHPLSPGSGPWAREGGSAASHSTLPTPQGIAVALWRTAMSHPHNVRHNNHIGNYLDKWFTSQGGIHSGGGNNAVFGADARLTLTTRAARHT